MYLLNSLICVIMRPIWFLTIFNPNVILSYSFSSTKIRLLISSLSKPLHSLGTKGAPVCSTLIFLARFGGLPSVGRARVFSMNFMVRIFGEKRCRPVYPAFQNRPQLINFIPKNRSFLRLRGSNRSSAGENGLAR